jgi:NADP-dependent aldehyde dehydrogenase
MTITGENYLGTRRSALGGETFQAFDPVANNALDPEFHGATESEVDAAAQLAEKAFEVYRRKSGRERAAFLMKIAEEIEGLGDDLINRCHQETGLPKARLQSERGRTTGQLRMFAELITEGSWVDARIETALPDRQPVPKPDLRSMLIALGPVGVFGASNFPLAFSVAGGDTASALAAGCTVVCKAHPSHPGTSELVASAILRAAEKTGMPEGVFSLLHGTTPDVGLAIVRHPLIQAIGFTGSFGGGKALFDEAAKRPVPIPVYAEMGSVNPVFILPGAQNSNADELSNMVTSSVTLGVGQFCTNPGILVTMSGKKVSPFEQLLAQKIEACSAGAMLSPGIRKNYEAALNNLKNQPDVELLSQGKNNGVNTPGVPHVLRTNVKSFLSNPELGKEVFGPSTLVVASETREELLAVAKALDGQLTATLIGTREELPDYADLVHVLERKVGRLIVNGLPTGVEVCHAMVHGGPFPATTDSRSTSVGTAAILRFVRAVCYQGFPQNLLPEELKDGNPLSIWRLVNGERTRS